jgi:GT2 family glycosyltransferase
VTVDLPLGLCVDSLLALDDRSFYLRGWMRKRDADLARLTAVSPEGSRAELLHQLVMYPRPDVEARYPTAESFSCFFDVASPSLKSGGWTFELEDAEGETLEVSARAVRDPEAAQQMIMGDLSVQVAGEESFLRNHAFPALRLLAERDWGAPELDRVIQFGDRPADPAVSLVVPLYRQIDLVELQLATFAGDPDIADADLVYVLDSPELAPDLIDYCEELHEIYRQPFRVATLKRHCGFAGATNVGVSLSTGRLLLLLNSDVVPRERGWLSAMARFYDETPRVGALGPKLLYEDDTIQHAGMYFEALPGKRLWVNSHFFKGMHRTLPAANQTRPVPAVTGACLMISRELFLDLGGLLSLYVQGDFEDSDLCLRAWRAGHENWYVAEVELYHLEGRSYDLATRQRNTAYNCWLHTELRNDAIVEVMADFVSS